MSNELARTTDLSDAPFTMRSLEHAVNTDLVNKGFKGNPPAALAAIYYGRELGMGPMESLNRLDNIDGRVAPSGEWIAGSIVNAGHRLEIVTNTDEVCTLRGSRVDADGRWYSNEVTFTMDQAKRANLAGKGAWKKYPEDMLYWRAVTRLARYMFADCLGGVVHVADELGEDHYEGPALDVEGDDPRVVDIDPEGEPCDMCGISDVVCNPTTPCCDDCTHWADEADVVEPVDIRELMEPPEEWDGTDVEPDEHVGPKLTHGQQLRTGLEELDGELLEARLLELLQVNPAGVPNMTKLGDWIRLVSYAAEILDYVHVDPSWAPKPDTPQPIDRDWMHQILASKGYDHLSMKRDEMEAMALFIRGAIKSAIAADVNGADE